MINEIVPFIFKHDQEQTPIRALNLDGDPWFVAVDVCRALGLENTTAALRSLDADEKNTFTNSKGTSGNPTHSIISEPGLYKLVGGSRKSAARAFDRFVRHEILPSIRKTGKYETASTDTQTIGGHDLLDAINSGVALVRADIAEIKGIVEDDPRAGFSAETLRYVCEGIANYEDCKCIFCYKNDVVTKAGKLLVGRAHAHHGDFNARNFNKDNCVVPCIDCHKLVHHPNKPGHIPHDLAVSKAKAFHDKLRLKTRQIIPPRRKVNPWSIEFATQGDLAVLAGWEQAKKKEPK